MTGGFYVYIIFRLNGIPCYVGKGRKNRWKIHFQLRSNSSNSNKHLTAIIKSAGGNLPVVLIRESLTNEEATLTEVALIKAIGREPEGPLVNFTDGGEGAPGHAFSPSDEWLKKMRRRTRRREYRELMRVHALGTSHNKGRKHSEQSRLNMRLGALGKRLSKKTRAKISAANKGRRFFLGKQHSEKTRALMSLSQKRRRESEALRGC